MVVWDKVMTSDREGQPPRKPIPTSSLPFLSFSLFLLRALVRVYNIYIYLNLNSA